MNPRELLISQYIDNELSLREKRWFIEEVAGDTNFAKEAMAFVDQEIMMLDAFCAPDKAMPSQKTGIVSPFSRRRAMAALVALAALLLVAAVIFWRLPAYHGPQANKLLPYRMVLYRPQASNVRVSGSFNNWRAVAMKPVGKSGYWEAVVKLAPGEYKYSFIVDYNHIIPDPSIIAREQDGFGGENSIVQVEADT